MKKFGVSPFATLLGFSLFLSLAPAASALTMPAVKISDDSGNVILIDGSAAVTYSGACTPATCVTTSVSVSSGMTLWSGSIGSFTLSAVVGTTKPYSVPNPSQDLNLQHVTSSTGGTLTVQWTDTDFNYSDINGATIAAGGLLSGSGTSTYTAYFDNANAPFGTGVPVGTIGPLPGKAFNGSVTGPGPTASPFSMTEVVSVTLGPGGVFGVDYEFIPLPAPLKLNCASGSAEVGVPYNSTLMALGGIAPYTYSIISGMLAPGLTLNTATGVITGTPTTGSTYSFTAQVLDSSQGLASTSTTTSTCGIVATQPPPISLACPLSTGEVGLPYTSGLAASGGIPPYTYSISSGVLPNGLSLNATTGAITGTPAQAGPFSFIGQVKDSTNSLAGTTTGNCGVTINSSPSANCAVINAVQNVPITPVAITASGGTGTGYTFSATGLPAGLTMSTGGTISGTPTVSGTFPYTVTITDSSGTKGTVNCSVIVLPPVGADCVVINAEQGVPITPVTMTATGGTGTGYTFSATGLPTGLTMSANGTISGTPTVSGTFPYTVTVTDSAGNKGTFSCSVTVQPPPSLTCAAINSGIAGLAFNSGPATVTGGTPPYTFSLASGSLPAGLSLNSSTGAITGTPLAAGSFTIKVTDAKGAVAAGTCPFTIAPQPTGGPLTSGDTATIGFWHNKNGQALIDSLNGGATSTNLANWLATQFPYLYGAHSANNLTNKTNADVAALFLTFFEVSGQKTNAQILAGALAVYVTNSSLAGNAAPSYGFNTSTTGTGGKTYNVGSAGTAIGLSNNTSYTVLQLLQQANLAMQNGTFNANAFNTIFDGINQTGDIN